MRLSWLVLVWSGAALLPCAPGVGARAAESATAVLDRAEAAAAWINRSDVTARTEYVWKPDRGARFHAQATTRIAQHPDRGLHVQLGVKHLEKEGAADPPGETLRTDYILADGRHIIH